MNKKTLIIALALGLAPTIGCERAAEPSAEGIDPNSEAVPVAAEVANAEAPVAHAEPAEDGPVPTSVTDDGARLFGDEMSGTAVTALTDLLATPADFDGQVVQTEGTISAVCQRMGCWMELKADDDGPAVRVPMAGHSFFLPKDVSGARATIEGTVEVRELPADWQDHLREEGAQAAEQPLGINATSVLIHAS